MSTEEIYKFLERKPTFLEDQHLNYICKMCRKVLVRACSAPCGCEFCRACAETYFGQGQQLPCPGRGCPYKERLCGINDLQEARGTDRRITELKTKCEWTMCVETGSVAEMVVHAMVCDHADVQCPYWVLGCGWGSAERVKVKDHVYKAGLDHAGFVVAKLQSLTNLINQQDRRIPPMPLANPTVTTPVHHQDAELAADMKTMLLVTSEQMNTVNTLQMKLDNLEKKFDTLEKRKLLTMEKEIRTLKEAVDSFKKKSGDLERILVNVKSDVTEVKHSCASGNAEVNNRVETVEKTLQSLNCTTYLWQVKDLPGKRAVAKRGGVEQIYSPSFLCQAQGYKFCIMICPDGCGLGSGTHLTIYFILMKGENDDILRWPCRSRIKLAIISQDGGSEVETDTCQYDIADGYRGCFDRPTEEMNVALGQSKFISWEDLNRNNSAMREGIVYIRCTIYPL